MRIYHYPTKAAAKDIVRLSKKGYLEFYFCSQEQSGHATGAYFTQKSPAEMANTERPISRFFGTKAFEKDDCFVFELEVPEDWSKGKATENKQAQLTPIPGERGDLGIALTMTKAKGYQDAMGDSDDILTKGDCMVLPLSCLKATYKIDPGPGKNKTLDSKVFNANTRNFIWN